MDKVCYKRMRVTDDENDIDGMLTADGQKISCVVVKRRTDNMDWSRMVIPNIHQSPISYKYDDSELMQVYKKLITYNMVYIVTTSYK